MLGYNHVFLIFVSADLANTAFALCLGLRAPAFTSPLKPDTKTSSVRTEDMKIYTNHQWWHIQQFNYITTFNIWKRRHNKAEIALFPRAVLLIKYSCSLQPNSLGDCFHDWNTEPDSPASWWKAAGQAEPRTINWCKAQAWTLLGLHTASHQSPPFDCILQLDKHFKTC